MLLLDSDEDEVFNNTITGLATGDYCFTLYVQDTLGNELVNESFLELNLQAVQNTPINLLTIGGASIGIFSAILISRKKKAGNNNAT